jgi:hypothetical protein
MLQGGEKVLSQIEEVSMDMTGNYKPTFRTPTVTWGTDWLRRGICGSGNQRA